MENSNGVAAPQAAEAVVDSNVEQVVQQVEGQQSVEAKPEVEKPLQDDKFASKFAALNRKEKALKAKEAELAAKIKELEAKSAPKQEEVAQPLPFEKRLKQDFFGTLKEVGFDLDTIVNIAVNDGKLPESMQQKLQQEELQNSVESKIAALERKLQEKEEQERKAREDAEAKQAEQQINEFKDSIKNSLHGKEEFELINSNDAHDLVYEVITQHWEDTKDPETGMGEFLKIEDAAAKVEEHLLAEAKKYVGLSKIQKLVGASPAKVEQKNDNKQASVTLSNTQSQALPGEESRFQTREELLAESLKLLRWNNNN